MLSIINIARSKKQSVRLSIRLEYYAFQTVKNCYRSFSLSEIFKTVFLQVSIYDQTGIHAQVSSAVSGGLYGQQFHRVVSL